MYYNSTGGLTSVLSWKMSYMQLRRNVYSVVVGYSVLCMSVKFRWLNVLNPFSLQPSDWFHIIVSRVLKAKSWLIGKDSDAGRDWGQEEKGTTEDDMAGWRHWLDGRESEWTQGVGDGQGGLAYCNSWGRRVGHDWATELNWLNYYCRTVCFSLWFYFASYILMIIRYVNIYNCYILLLYWIFY